MATLQTLDRAGVERLLARAGLEGWNPGTGDAAAFFATDPQGFMARIVQGHFAAGISVVRHAPGQAFLGLYLADPSCRGQGHGLALWQQALARFDGVSVGLDGVAEQQANYARSGFVFLHRNVRWQGPVTGDAGAAATRVLRLPERVDRDGLIGLDAEVGGFERQRFIDAWCLEGSAHDRHTLLAERQGRLIGMGTIRRCSGAHKLGPLIAPSVDVARALIDALVARAGAREVMIDVPQPNRAAGALVRQLGFDPVFETARMYRGAAPAIDMTRLFGVATLELG